MHSIHCGSEAAPAARWVVGWLVFCAPTSQKRDVGARLGVVRVSHPRRGELQAVENQAGAVDVQLVGGEALEDLVEGALERDWVRRCFDLEAATRAAFVGIGDRVAIRVVVVAEALAAERR